MSKFIFPCFCWEHFLISFESLSVEKLSKSAHECVTLSCTPKHVTIITDSSFMIYSGKSRRWLACTVLLPCIL